MTERFDTIDGADHTTTDNRVIQGAPSKGFTVETKDSSRETLLFPKATPKNMSAHVEEVISAERNIISQRLNNSGLTIEVSN